MGAIVSRHQEVEARSHFMKVLGGEMVFESEVAGMIADLQEMIRNRRGGKILPPSHFSRNEATLVLVTVINAIAPPNNQGFFFTPWGGIIISVAMIDSETKEGFAFGTHDRDLVVVGGESDDFSTEFYVVGTRRFCQTWFVNCRPTPLGVDGARYIHRERLDWVLAFMMGWHPRLGEGGLLSTLDGHISNMILAKVFGVTRAVAAAVDAGVLAWTPALE